MLGRTDEATAEQALLPRPTTDEEAVEQALARRFTAFIATGTADESELDAPRRRGCRPTPSSASSCSSAGPSARRARRLPGARDDWRDPLLAVRPRLGWAATMTVVRDLWSKIASLMFFVALAIGLVAAMWPR